MNALEMMMGVDLTCWKVQEDYVTSVARAVVASALALKRRLVFLLLSSWKPLGVRLCPSLFPHHYIRPLVIAHFEESNINQP